MNEWMNTKFNEWIASKAWITWHDITDLTLAFTLSHYIKNWLILTEKFINLNFE